MTNPTVSISFEHGKTLLTLEGDTLFSWPQSYDVTSVSVDAGFSDTDIWVVLTDTQSKVTHRQAKISPNPQAVALIILFLAMGTNVKNIYLDTSGVGIAVYDELASRLYSKGFYLSKSGVLLRDLSSSELEQKVSEEGNVLYQRVLSKPHVADITLKHGNQQQQNVISMFNHIVELINSNRAYDLEEAYKVYGAAKKYMNTHYSVFKYGRPKESAAVIVGLLESKLKGSLERDSLGNINVDVITEAVSFLSEIKSDYSYLYESQ